MKEYSELLFGVGFHITPNYGRFDKFCRKAVLFRHHFNGDVEAFGPHHSRHSYDIVVKFRTFYQPELADEIRNIYKVLGDNVFTTIPTNPDYWQVVRLPHCGPDGEGSTTENNIIINVFVCLSVFVEGGESMDSILENCLLRVYGDNVSLHTTELFYKYAKKMPEQFEKFGYVLNQEEVTFEFVEYCSTYPFWSEDLKIWLPKRDISTQHMKYKWRLEPNTVYTPFELLNGTISHLCFDTKMYRKFKAFKYQLLSELERGEKNYAGIVRAKTLYQNFSDVLRIYLPPMEWQIYRDPQQRRLLDIIEQLKKPVQRKKKKEKVTELDVGPTTY
eukprot:TRINITY_DN57_c0_g1_i6.p1 TRINITY_DN57_c0_g1~~TRINITY_DN57_c0_g1_i6.p1  ORF type:complete len:364 (-),score=72.45 TRINITY_DN57_c0_g1_i6:39-1031(-)